MMKRSWPLQSCSERRELMYKVKIQVGYAYRVLKFRDFGQVQDFLRYLVDGDEEKTSVEIWREKEEGKADE